MFYWTVVHLLISPLRRQKLEGLYEFKVSLNYRTSSRTIRATEKPCLENKNKQKVYVPYKSSKIRLAGKNIIKAYRLIYTS